MFRLCYLGFIGNTFFIITDGQKIAKKLCTQISKETKRVKILLEEYHSCHFLLQMPSEISLSDALNPSFVRTLLASFSDVPTTVTADKLEAIQAYLMASRSREEVSMLREDVVNIVSYYDKKKEVLRCAAFSLVSNSDPYSRGSLSLLRKCEQNFDRLLTKASLTLEKMSFKDGTELELDEVEDDSCDSDSSCDSD